MADVPGITPATATTELPDGVARRDFLKVAGAGAGALLLGACGPAERPVPGIQSPKRFSFLRSSPDVVIVGAGAFGGWTAYHLRRMGAKVTLVDAYGPGNARSTSGDETRGVRSSYGDREKGGDLWMLWARESMQRWKQFDADWGRELNLSLYHTTGDLIFREEWEPFTTRTRDMWVQHKIPHEVLQPDEVRKRWPVINIDDITVVLHEPDAGVVRARRSTQAVAAAFQHLGGTIVTARVKPPTSNGKLNEIELDNGQKLRADTFVFACGAWLRKTFPDLLESKMRTPLGRVCYFATPPNDNRFTYPNLPSWNFPGVTGWAALPADNRGFRVRGSIRAKPVPGAPPVANTPVQPPAPTPPAQLDPDLSERWFEEKQIEGPRRVLEKHFPLLTAAPLNQIHACHYESSASNNWIIDRHPRMPNLWIAGAGNAEAFKSGPVIGEYVAQRVLGEGADPEVVAGFRIPDHDYKPNQGAFGPPPPDTAKKADSLVKAR